MTGFEKGLKKLINENRTNELTDYIDKKLSSRIFRKKNEKELLRLLPLIIENTNNKNCNWISNNYILLFRDKKFLNIIINNIKRFDFQKSDYILHKLLTNMQHMSKEMWEYNILKQLDDSILECDCELNGIILGELHAINHQLRSKYPDIESYMFKKYLFHEKTFNEIIKTSSIMDSIDKKIISVNIDYILEELQPIHLFRLKELCKEDKTATKKIKEKIDEFPKKYI